MRFASRRCQFSCPAEERVAGWHPLNDRRPLDAPARAFPDAMIACTSSPTATVETDARRHRIATSPRIGGKAEDGAARRAYR
jgi:hypothetical protein